MKAIILAGGFGSRLSEETNLRPKPMVVDRGRAILWHIMNMYACVIPSLYENFPNTCLEAMASGCAVLASAVGGVPEMIEDEANGLLLPRGRPNELAAAVLRLLSEPSLRKQLASRARATVQERFGARAICAQTESVYRSLLT